MLFGCPDQHRFFPMPHLCEVRALFPFLQLPPASPTKPLTITATLTPTLLTHHSSTGLQAQSVVYSQSSLDGEPVVLIDPNTLSADGTVALSSWAFSEDGSTLAYALSSGGSDWQTVHVLGVDPGMGATTQHPDTLRHVKFSCLAWTHDGRGFFYNRFPPPPGGGGEAGTETARADNQELAYHVLGDDQAWDVTILALPEHPDWMIGCEVSDDGGRAILSISSGCEPVNRVWILDLNAVGRRADGALDFSPFAHGAAGSRELPLNKLVDEFKVREILGWEEKGLNQGSTLWR